MITDETIHKAAAIIRSGGLVAFPTETVYGLGANALDALAVARIFELKGRPRFDPLIVHVAGLEEVERLVERIPESARKLVDRFWPGPLSIVLPKRPIVPDIVTAGLPSVAIRYPSHEVACRLIRAAGVPIAAPSANRFGAVSPTRAEHVVEQFGDAVPLVLDGGPCQVGVESTVVSFLQETPLLLRPGGVPLEELEAVLGSVQLATSDERRPASPGMLPRHYAPATPLQLVTNEPRPAPEQPSAPEPRAAPELQPAPGRQAVPAGRVGLLTLQSSADQGEFAAVEVLSERGCLREAAANLFAALRRLDAQRLDLIVARPVPEQGLGRAIMDRLRRAAEKADRGPAENGAHSTSR